MVNIIWCSFILIGIVYYLVTGNLEKVNLEIINSTKTSFDMMLKIFPLLALWLGIMNISKASGLLDKVSKRLSPLFSKLFPDIPKGHESIGFITSNVVANIFGLGNAATPFGIKAMKSLQQLSKKKDVASRSMITFLVLNTSGLTIVPTTIISLKMMHGSINPTDIVLPCFLATLCSTIGGILMDRFLAHRSRK